MHKKSKKLFDPKKVQYNLSARANTLASLKKFNVKCMTKNHSGVL
jgi:hypothetical protein